MQENDFRERNRQRREEQAFSTFRDYARQAGTPNPEKAARIAARSLHGGDARDGGVEDGRAATAARGDAEPRPVPHRLDDRTKEQLYDRAREMGIEGRSQMNRDDLIEAIRDRR
jgi:hypothetical protein